MVNIKRIFIRRTLLNKTNIMFLKIIDLHLSKNHKLASNGGLKSLF